MAEYQYLVASGVILPDTTDLQAGVQQEFRDAFGADLSVEANTPQGLLITGETIARDAVVRNNAALANQINPNIAGGVFLDAIWALTGGQRFRATPTTIAAATLTGEPGAIVPAGSQASVGEGGPIFETVSPVTIGAGGTVVVAFQALDDGPQTVPVGALDTIVSAVLGWESVANTVAAVLGQSEETDAASRTRRRNTLALQGVGLVEAIMSAVSDVAGVTGCIVRENFTSAPVVIDGVNLVANSVFACVDGGTDADVAAALLANKSLGCNWNGTTTVDVLNVTSGQVYPVKFQRPTDVPIYVSVTVRAGSAVSDPQATARQAILDYAAGQLSGEAGFTVGGDVSPFELAAAINSQAVDLFVTDLKIGTAPGALAAATVAIGISERATVISGNIAVIIA